MGSFLITAGTSPTTYSPEGMVTRGQLAAFVARLLATTRAELPAAAPDAFRDDDDSPFEPEIDLLAALGVVSGTGADRFSPESSVTRAQVAAVLARAYAFRSPWPLAAGPELFSDVADQPLQSAVSQAAAAAIVTGHGDGTYRPTSPLTRAQVASLLARALFVVGAVDGVELRYPDAPVHYPQPV